MPKLYLDPFLDMCNGEILSFGIDDCPYRKSSIQIEAEPYQMKAYSHRLKEERIFQGMSRKDTCPNNSVMETFFGLLKQKIYFGVIFYSCKALKEEIEKYIKHYNKQRIKENLGWLKPVHIA